MILSYKYKFVFFAIPKTGSHSIRFALRPYLEETDLEQVTLFKKSALPQVDLASIKHGHLSYLELLPHFNNELLSFFTFAFVRNPYDRFISCFFFLKRPSDDSPKANRDNMKRFLEKSNNKNMIHLLPQHTFLVNQEHKLAVTYVGKLESYNNDLQNVFQKIGLSPPTYLKVNTSHHLDYKLYYDAELAAMVEDMYAKDFEFFGYEPELKGSTKTTV